MPDERRSMILLLALAAGAPNLSGEIKRAVEEQECDSRGADADEVIVCSHRRERDRYRLPEIEREDIPLDDQRPNSVRERARWIEGGEAGTTSCGPVGPGGWTGCQQQRVRKARQQKNGWYGV